MTQSVTPSSVTLAPGASQRFTSVGIDQYGNPIATSPVWTATGGSIDSTGLYVAGSVAGDFVVNDGSARGQASVRIEALTQVPSVSFTDVSVNLGLTSDFRSYATTWGDYDNDGWMDMFMNNHSRVPPLLLHNDGGIFINTTDSAGVNVIRDHHSCRWADFDNDGNLDLYCSTGAAGGSGSQNANLWRNNGDQTFTDIAAQAGVANAEGRGRAINWIDIDADGDLDLFVGNDSDDPSQDISILYRNDNGIFVDVTSQINNELRGEARYSLVFDYKEDGDWDLLIRLTPSANAPGYTGPCDRCSRHLGQ